MSRDNERTETDNAGTGTGQGSSSIRATCWLPERGSYAEQLPQRRSTPRSVSSGDHRVRMQELERHIYEDLEPVEFETEHLFAKGTYTRVLHVPAGHVLTGHIHRESCINFVMKGRMRIATDEGDREVGAGEYFVTGAGVKKAGFALEDTIWINVFPNAEEERDEDVLVERLTYIDGYEQLDREQQEKLPHIED